MNQEKLQVLANRTKSDWENYEKELLLNFANFTLYWSNAEMHASSKLISSFNRVAILLGDFKSNYGSLEAIAPFLREDVNLKMFEKMVRTSNTKKGIANLMTKLASKQSKEEKKQEFIKSKLASFLQGGVGNKQ